MELKELRKEIKKLGYKVKTYTYSSSSLRFLEVLDLNNTFVCGAGVNVYPKEFILKHSDVFELLRINKDNVFNGTERVSF